MRVLESLEQIELLGHSVSPHQLLVDVFHSHHAFGAPVVAALDDRETTPDEKTTQSVRLLYRFLLP